MIRSKTESYALLRAGKLGNALRNWERPEDVPGALRRSLRFGLRQAAGQGGGVFCYGLTWQQAQRLWMPSHYVSEMFPDSQTVLNAEIMDAPGGLVLSWRNEKGESCREAARRGWHLATGLAARLILQARLTEASYHDLELLLDQYPGHVVELSAAACMVGSWPGRNHCVWEVRVY